MSRSFQEDFLGAEKVESFLWWIYIFLNLEELFIQMMYFREPGTLNNCLIRNCHGERRFIAKHGSDRKLFAPNWWLMENILDCFHDTTRTCETIQLPRCVWCTDQRLYCSLWSVDSCMISSQLRERQLLSPTFNEETRYKSELFITPRCTATYRSLSVEIILSWKLFQPDADW